MATEIVTPMQMYWITRLSPIGYGLSFIIVLLLFIALGQLVAGGVMQDCNRTNETGIKLIKTSAVAAIVLLLVNCMLPTTRDMAAILIVPRIANSEKVQTVGNHLYDLAVEWMEDLRPAKNREGAK